MVNLDTLVRADSLPLDLSVPLCHPREDKWGRITTAKEDGTVAVAWNDNSRSVTKPLGWFRRRPSTKPGNLPVTVTAAGSPTYEQQRRFNSASEAVQGAVNGFSASTNTPTSTERYYVVKREGNAYGPPKRTYQDAEDLARLCKEATPRKLITVEEVNVARRTVAVIESRGSRKTVAVPTNGGA